MHDHPCRGFPQPIAHLAVKRLDLVGLSDMRVIEQAIQKLRPVHLRINRLQFDALDKCPLLWSIFFRTRVQSARTVPNARHTRERAKIGQRIDVWIFGFGVNVFWKIAHTTSTRG